MPRWLTGVDILELRLFQKHISPLVVVDSGNYLKENIMTTREVANKLVGHCRAGHFASAIKELYSKDIVSIEPDGAPVREVVGLDGVKQKAENFNSMVEEVHGMEISDPVIADNFFSCSMKMDVTFKGAPRTSMEEICLYQVKKGKIVKEEFFFTPMSKG